MFPLTITLQTRAQLDAVLAALYPSADTPLPVITAAPGPAPVGKSAATTDVPAPSSRTARAATAPAAPEKTAAASAPAAATAAAPSPASTAAPEPFQYKTLQALVLKLLPTHQAQLNDIARKHGEAHGATTFKGLPPEAWEAAFADVKALEAA